MAPALSAWACYDDMSSIVKSLTTPTPRHGLRCSGDVDGGLPDLAGTPARTTLLAHTCCGATASRTIASSPSDLRSLLIASRALISSGAPASLRGSISTARSRSRSLSPAAAGTASPGWPRPDQSGRNRIGAFRRQSDPAAQRLRAPGASRPSSRARLTASARLCTPSLAYTLRMCVRIVFSDTNSSAAISDARRLVGR